MLGPHKRDRALPPAHVLDSILCTEEACPRQCTFLPSLHMEKRHDPLVQLEKLIGDEEMRRKIGWQKCMLACRHAPPDVARFMHAVISTLLETDENMGSEGRFVSVLEPMCRPLSPATAPCAETIADIVRSGMRHDLVGVMIHAAEECGETILREVKATVAIWHKSPPTQSPVPPPGPQGKSGSGRIFRPSGPKP